MVALAPSSGTDWTDEERAHLGRIESLCHSTEQWEMECLHTEAGDPWCIIYDRHAHVVVLHLARIDRRYVIVWPEQRRSITRATMEAAIDAALGELVVRGAA